MNKVNYAYSCVRCKDEKLFSNDYWDDLHIPQDVNTGYHGHIESSVLLCSIKGCYGCIRVTRRKIKILILLLHRLRVMR